MSWFKIYAGLKDPFDGAKYHGTYEYESTEDAVKDARRLAEEEYEYQSYEGLYGILSYDDCEVECRNMEWIGPDMSQNEIDDVVDSYYLEKVKSWISYSAIPAEGAYDREDE